MDNLQQGAYDETEERSLCNLFGFAYAEIRGQLCPIADLFEEVIEGSGLVRLDKDRSKQFELLFLPGCPTFHNQPLSPPEVYIGHNFSK